MSGHRLHRREVIVNRAKNEMVLAILDIVMKHKLTRGEELRVINDVASEKIGQIAKYDIREERHPGDPDKPGGFE